MWNGAVFRARSPFRQPALFCGTTYNICSNAVFAVCWAMRYSTSDLSRKSGDIIARALQGPVTITQRGKPRLILMSVEEYNRLRKTPKAGVVETISGEPNE
jgi:prevent-host-death family protein